MTLTTVWRAAMLLILCGLLFVQCDLWQEACWVDVPAFDFTDDVTDSKYVC